MGTLFKSRATGPVMAIVGLATSLVFALRFPAVEGLGTKVRLPVFHGALTWVNLMAFALLFVLALTYAIGRDERIYPWVEALRWTAIPLWFVGSVLGLIAALNTWDFTGSKSSPMEVAAADPRLNAQFWILVVAVGVLAVGFLFDDRRWLAFADAGFVVVAGGVLARAILGPGRALHPDSPVMNSEEIGIKLMFLGIVAGQLLMTWGIALAIKTARAGRATADSAA